MGFLFHMVYTEIKTPSDTPLGEKDQTEGKPVGCYNVALKSRLSEMLIGSSHYKHFATLALTSANHVYVTNKMLFDLI